MDVNSAIDALSALAQPTRLAAFRLLIREGPAGLLAGEIASRLRVLQNTMSTNLAVLERAGLVRGQREGRAIRYRSDIPGMRGLLAYLMEDCCQGRPELCGDLMSVKKRKC
jgi:DNA-binding transcriptional ArsR family regulator